MSEFNASNFKKEEGGQGPDLCGVTELTSPYFMVPPSGTTAQRPSGCAPGTLRFNTDIGSLEYFKGDTIGWESIVKTTPNLGGGTGSNVGLGGRAIYGTSSSPYPMEYITISTLGNSQDFGDLNDVKYWGGGLGSRTRGVVGGGYNGVDTIQFCTFAQLGNFTDFGNLTDGRHQMNALSNEIRGCFVCGTGPAHVNTIDYITISATGNAVDFGDCTRTSSYIMTASSTTRGLIAGGNSNVIDYITIMTTGNAADFGDLDNISNEMGGQVTSATRAVFGGGKSPATTNVMEYITMATLGNSIDFGDLATARYQIDAGVTSSPTRGIFGGGSTGSGVNIIEYIEIATTGNALDFGDFITADISSSASMSNSHGGL